jgi:hypothetical protein
VDRKEIMTQSDVKKLEEPAPDGRRRPQCRSDSAEQMEAACAIMKKRRNALRELAK